LLTAETVCAQEYMSGMEWQEPPIVTPGKSAGDPPSDATVLFDGKNLSAWENGDKWKVEDGVATVQNTDITSKQSFGDCQLHVEWSAPTPAKGEGQGRGNSGVYLMDRYEMQVLDSYDNKTYFDGQAGAIYKQTPPMVNAMRKPGEWNTYDIVWTAPKFKEDGSLESPAYITALHNGVLVLNHFEVQGATPFTQAPHYETHGKLPIHLQNHGDPVRFRNIWVREIKPPVGKRVREPYFKDHETGKETPVHKSTSTTGRITIDGKPIEQGAVVFNAKGASTRFISRVLDGDFQARGIQPGTYIVTLEAPEDAEQLAKIPAKYLSADESGLRVEVRDGANSFEFDLKANGR
jgi:hypothetical protein